MKKVGFGILTIVLAILLNGCSLFVKLSAEATIENNTDKTFVCMASYNNSLGTNEQPWELAPGGTKKLTLEGHLTEADYNDSSEEFKLFYMEKDIYETAIAEHDWWTPWYTLTSSSGHKCVKAIDKRSQSYRVVFNNTTDGSNNYTVEVTW